MSTLQRVETRLQHVETRLQHVETRLQAVDTAVLSLCNLMHHPDTVQNQSHGIQRAAETLEVLKSLPAGHPQEPTPAFPSS